jgi:hypothetical protein
VTALGGVIDHSSQAPAFTLSPKTLVVCLVVYGFAASVLPVWMLLAPRDYLSTFMKVGTMPPHGPDGGPPASAAARPPRWSRRGGTTTAS